MTIQEYVLKLRAKPEPVRKQIIVLGTGVCMVFVVLIWIFTLVHRFTPSVAVQSQNDVKPFAIFGNSIKTTFQNITASVASAPSLKGNTNDATSNLTPANNANSTGKMIPLEVVPN